MTPTPDPQVRQLRTVLLVDDLDAALAWYRDVLGMPEEMALAGPDGARVVILQAGRATLELGNAAQGRFIDDVETGGLPGTPVRLAVEVDDTDAVTERLAAAGGRVLGAPAVMPWGSRNSRLDGPAGVQLTVFAAAGGAEGGPPGWSAEPEEPAGPSVADRLAALVGRSADDLGGEAGLLATTVDLAAAHAAAGHHPFVAVVVRDGVVVGGGANTVTTTHDPAAHGEVEAVRDACRRTGSADLAGAVVLSSCEPCAICRTVAAAAGVREIVWAADASDVPAAMDADPGRSAALAAAVSAVVPGIARRGAAVPDAARPFRVWTERRSGAIG